MLISFGGNHAIPKVVLEKSGIVFKVLKRIKEEEF